MCTWSLPEEGGPSLALEFQATCTLRPTAAPLAGDVIARVGDPLPLAVPELFPHAESRPSAVVLAAPRARARRVGVRVDVIGVIAGTTGRPGGGDSLNPRRRRARTTAVAPLSDEALLAGMADGDQDAAAAFV